MIRGVYMEKIFVLKGLDCPHCSSKIEKAVSDLSFVSASSVNLINQTLTIDFNCTDDYDITADIEKIVHKYEPYIDVTEKSEACEKSNEDYGRIGIISIAAGATVYLAGLVLSYFSHVSGYVTLGIFITAYLILGFDVLLQAVKNILKGRVFDENFLMSVSTLGAFAIHEYPEAVAVMLFYRIGEFFENSAVRRSRRSISSLLDIRPDSAHILRNGGEVTVNAENVCIGDMIIVKSGERVPLDGIIAEGESMLDTVALTGESVPRKAVKGDSILSGCINQGGALTVEVTKTFQNSTASKIIDLVENAASKKAPTENFITVFSRYYTPFVVILALFLAVIPPVIFGQPFGEWIRRGCVFLVISCPCALVISIPLTFFGGIGSASKKGVLIKGGNYLEALNKITAVVFDKTGTLTKGVFKVTDIIPSDGFTADEVLEYASKAELMSNHPIARSVADAYGRDIPADTVSNYREIAGKGVVADNNGIEIGAGNERLMQELGIKITPADGMGTKVYVSAGKKYAGAIIISDEIKDGCREALSALKKAGIRKTVMLTGDNRRIAEAVAEELCIDEYKAELLPDMKVSAFEQIDPMGGKIAFVGDGINDAPVLSRADVGIAMGALGSDAAIEAADVVLMKDDINSLTDAIYTAKATKRIVMQNIVFALGVKILFLILGAFGIAGMWEAVFGDVGVMIIAVLNAVRILKK